MVIVKGVIPVRNEVRESALALVQALARRARDEEGCLSYEVYVQADAPRIIMLWQQWTTLDALEDHFDSDHLDTFLDSIPDMIDGDVHSLHFDVSDEDETELPEPSALSLADDTVLH